MRKNKNLDEGRVALLGSIFQSTQYDITDKLRSRENCLLEDLIDDLDIANIKVVVIVENDISNVFDSDEDLDYYLADKEGAKVKECQIEVRENRRYANIVLA